MHIQTLQKKTVFRGLAASAVVMLTGAAFSPVVSAQAASGSASQTYQVNLKPANNSGASGTATVTVNGSSVTVAVRGAGFSPNLAHAAHFHIGGQMVCPTSAADTDKDGFVSSKEAEPYVGPMKVSLTTSGDTSTNSALAVDRMPKADAKGALAYNRTFALPAGVSATDMAKASIDIHGTASLFNDKTKYDGDKKSELDAKLPYETTVPAACGRLTSTPTGGAATGTGSVSGIESPGMLIGGTIALTGAVAAGLLARKQLASRN